MNNEIYAQLSAIAGKDNVFTDIIMKEHTTFRIGGAADYFVTPDTINKVVDTVNYCRNNKVPYYILGNGSNLLVSDKGFRGVIIQIYNNLSNIEIYGDIARVQAGCLLTKFSRSVASNGYTGFEFASGIPGTVGGALTMNAGAYGGEMKDVVEEVKVITPEGMKVLHANEMNFGYRHSVVMEKGYIVVEAVFNLFKGDSEKIKKTMTQLRDMRKSKQPLEYPSAGSTFKRPEGYFAGKLIMDAGLKGYTVGGAQIAQKHCGFVINRSNATAKDVKELINHVQAEVKSKFGVTLEPEVRMLGEF